MRTKLGALFGFGHSIHCFLFGALQKLDDGRMEPAHRFHILTTKSEIRRIAQRLDKFRIQDDLGPHSSEVPLRPEYGS